MTFTYVFSGCFSPIIGSTLYENLDFVRLEGDLELLKDKLQKFTQKFTRSEEVV